MYCGDIAKVLLVNILKSVKITPLNFVNKPSVFFVKGWSNSSRSNFPQFIFGVFYTCVASQRMERRLRSRVLQYVRTLNKSSSCLLSSENLLPFGIDLFHFGFNFNCNYTLFLAIVFIHSVHGNVICKHNPRTFNSKWTDPFFGI